MLMNDVNWPAYNVERRPLAELVPYARNARLHSETQISQVAASIREWGWTMPVLVREDGTIVAGHCRVMAAAKLCLEEGPVMVAKGWSDAQCKAYVLADNQLTLAGSWDPDLLAVEVRDLQEMHFDLDLLGFEQDALDGLLDDPEPEAGETDPDDVPEPPEDPISVEGDIWVCGSHRVMVGDSTRLDHVAQLMGDGLADLLITDPHYNVAYEGKTKCQTCVFG